MNPFNVTGVGPRISIVRERTVNSAKLFNEVGKMVDFHMTSHAEIQTEDTDGGFVRAIEVKDGGHHAEIPISRFRSDLGHDLGWNTVISNAFTMERQGGEYIVRGRGFGHNVGLCIEGLASVRGRSRLEIDFELLFSPFGINRVLLKCPSNV